ncbi:hypothetical protein GCM10025868_01540 [Angustibacter aerolatus]|uniref:CopC domain-containing protein n=1 Tax=Angustibacter aerolatus TaxID=1162965 RepID=A0ABQ6JCI1_9ACTN|nr:hypothetical protein GCM10025868_01540 [Angustibacter aerolatus]
MYVEAPPVANTGPAGGFQFFGEVHVDAASHDLTVRLRGVDGGVRFRQTISAHRR